MRTEAAIFRKPAKIRWQPILINGALTVIGFIWLMPLIMTILLSIRPRKDTLGTGNIFFGNGFSLEWFQYAFDTQPWGTYYISTLIFVFGLLAMQLVTITLAGYAFARLNFFGRDFIFMLILVQIMIPSAVLLVPNFATVRFLNLYDTKFALMLPYIGSAFGTFLMRQTFRQIPRELEDAARIDGCNWLGLLRHVYIPSSISGYIAFSLASVSAHWNEFLWPLIITRSDDNRVLTVGLGQILRNESGVQYGLVAAGTLIVVAPLLLLFMLFQRQFINSFLRSGLK
jgi:sn-glycerol 3-phosphate transport system permease protein